MVKSLQQFAKQSSLQAPLRAVDWCQLGSNVAYDMTLSEMERAVAAILSQEQAEQVWLLEHPPLYTAGTSAKRGDLLSEQRFPVFDVGRGGQYTYHGPGQRICYVMLDLNQRGRDVRALITSLEAWVIKTLAHFGVVGEIRSERVGVWVARPDKPRINGQICEDKIAAIGIRLRRWVSFHGLSLNVRPDLEHYAGIVPCGIATKASGHGVTSLHDLGMDVSMEEVDAALKAAFIEVFGSPVNEHKS